MLVIIGVVIGVLVSDTPDKSEKPQKNQENIEVDDNKNDDGNLHIKEDDGTVDNRTDASGSWEETKEDNTDNSNSDNSHKGTSQEDEEDDSEEDVLIDDKEWGRIY